MNTSLQTVPFYQDSIFVIDHNGEPFIPLRPICQNIGLNWKTQYRKIQSNAHRYCPSKLTTQLTSGDQHREMVCVPLVKLFGWLCSISPKKVAPHLKEKIRTYQRECDEVLWNYWAKGVGATDQQLYGNILVNKNTYVHMTKALFTYQNNENKRLAVAGKAVGRQEAEGIKKAVVSGLSVAKVAHQFGRSESTVKKYTMEERAARRKASGVKQLSLFGKGVAL